MAQERQSMTPRFGTEERNMARLSPVVGFNRISSQMVGWHKTVQVDHMGPVEVICSAGRDQVVPHGIDADVLFALTTLYDWQGQPQNGQIRVSVHDLCNAAGLSHGGTTYERVRESLQRWLLVTYKISECWGTPNQKGKWDFSSLTFGVITSLRQKDHGVPDNHTLGKFYASTFLEITLNASLIQSMVIGHIRNIDINILKNLSSPLTRILYRALEELRQIPGANSESYTIGIRAWGDHLGLRTLVIKNNEAVHDISIKGKVPQTEILSPSKIRRTLAPAHEELIKIGYLKASDFIGRGSEQQIHYRFGKVDLPNSIESDIANIEITKLNDNPDSDLIQVLTDRFVGQKKASELAMRYSKDQILDAAEKFDAKRAARYKMHSPGGFMVKILEQPENYPHSVPIEPILSEYKPQKTNIIATETEELQVERNHQSAYQALGKRFEENSAMREYRNRATQLYIKGRISIINLIDLKTLEPIYIENKLKDWECESN